MTSNEKVGFLFPGQGAQFPGMGKDLYDRYESVKSLYALADKILGYSVSQICFEGPEEKITRTLYAQPGIYVTSMAALMVLKEKRPEIKPSFAAGLSLGEFSALAAIGAISFEEGLKLVAARAEAMEDAAKKYPGTMASVMGLPQGECEVIARESGAELANLNSPDQFVLSGTVEAIEKACGIAEAKGAKRALRLKVGGAFHSSLMADAREKLKKALASTVITPPACAFIPNAAAVAVTAPEEIRELLAKQLTSPVRWIETMQRAAESGTVKFLEIGPGKVLKGLAKKCQPSLVVNPVGTGADFEALEKAAVS